MFPNTAKCFYCGGQNVSVTDCSLLSSLRRTHLGPVLFIVLLIEVRACPPASGRKIMSVERLGKNLGLLSNSELNLKAVISLSPKEE